MRPYLLSWNRRCLYTVRWRRDSFLLHARLWLAGGFVGEYRPTWSPCSRSRFGQDSWGSPTPLSCIDSEFVIRTSDRKRLWTVLARASKKSFLSEFARDDDAGSLVVLHDETAQDEAGANPLSYKFMHDTELYQQNFAAVIFKNGPKWFMEYKRVG